MSFSVFQENFIELLGRAKSFSNSSKKRKLADSKSTKKFDYRYEYTYIFNFFIFLDELKINIT